MKALFNPAVAVLLFALIVRLVVFWYDSDIFMSGPDSYEYLQMSTSLVSDQTLFLNTHIPTDNPDSTYTLKRFCFFPPIFPIMSAAWLFLASVSSLPYFNIFLNSLIVIPAYLITKNLFGSKAGIITCLAVSLFPPHIYYSIAFSTDGLSTLLVIFSIHYILKPNKNHTSFVILGILSGLTILCRPAYLLLPFAIAIFMKIEKTSFRDICLYLTPMILILSIWIVRNNNVTGKFVPLTSQGGYVLWVSNNPQADRGGENYFLPFKETKPYLSNEVLLDNYYKQKAINWITENPSSFIQLSFKSLYRFLRPFPSEDIAPIKRWAAGISTLTVYLLFFQIFFFSPRKLLTLKPIIIMILSIIPVILLTHALARYRLPLDVLIFILGTGTLAYLIEQRNKNILPDK